MGRSTTSTKKNTDLQRYHWDIIAMRYFLKINHEYHEYHEYSYHRYHEYHWDEIIRIISKIIGGYSIFYSQTWLAINGRFQLGKPSINSRLFLFIEFDHCAQPYDRSVMSQGISYLVSLYTISVYYLCIRTIYVYYL